MLVDLKKAEGLLRNGEVVAVPTETVYGVAADLFQEKALLELYNLKKRESQKPIVIQLAHPSDVYDFLSHIPFDLKKIMQKFWPGALTLVLPIKESKVPALSRAHLPAAGFRVSAHPTVRELIQSYGPLAITSANISGHPPLLDAKEIEEQFGKDFPILSSKYQEAQGVASTVIAYIDASWVVLRLGSIDVYQLGSLLGYLPPVVSDIDMKASTYTLRPQLHLKERPYDGSIPVVLGFEDRKYTGSEAVLNLGKTTQKDSFQKRISQCLIEIQNEEYPHVWVDLNFAKEGELKKLAESLERAVRASV